MEPVEANFAFRPAASLTAVDTEGATKMGLISVSSVGFSVRAFGLGRV